MLGILFKIEEAKGEIEFQKWKTEQEKREGLQNWEIVVKMAEYDIRKAENTIKNEQIEKHRLLNHENEIMREAAQELYDKYLRMSDSTRRCQY